jgi:hypothetical protein
LEVIMKVVSRSPGRSFAWTLGAVALGAMSMVGCASSAPPATAPAVVPAPADPGAALAVVDPTHAWGIELSSLRTTAAGSMLDVRYRVLDGEKARAVLNPTARLALIDQTSGKVLAVPSGGKVGALRQVARNPQVGKIYTLLFGNPGRLVQSGSRVTLVVGEQRVRDLAVQ